MKSQALYKLSLFNIVLLFFLNTNNWVYSKDGELFQPIVKNHSSLDANKPHNNITMNHFSYNDDLLYSRLQDLPKKQSIQTSKPENLTPLVYMHFFGGIGLSYLSSSDIESLLGDDFGIGIGLPTWSYGFLVGFSNIFQIEFNMGNADHNFNNNSILEDVPNEIIEMDYDTRDWQLKLNPFFFKKNVNEKGLTEAYFIVIGTGNVEWVDKNNDGFEGTSQIYGIEYSRFSKNISWSISFKRYGLDFKRTILFNIPFDFKTEAADYILEFKLGIGLGI